MDINKIKDDEFEKSCILLFKLYTKDEIIDNEFYTKCSRLKKWLNENNFKLINGLIIPFIGYIKGYPNTGKPIKSYRFKTLEEAYLHTIKIGDKCLSITKTNNYYEVRSGKKGYRKIDDKLRMYYISQLSNDKCDGNNPANIEISWLKNS
jgi:hypothetical protein